MKQGEVLRLLPVLLALTVVAGCGGGSETLEGAGDVMVTVRASSQLLAETQQVTVSISASDLGMLYTTEVQAADFAGGQAVVTAKGIPAGRNRTVAARAFDDIELVVGEGSTSLTVQPDQTNPVAVQLASVPPSLFEDFSTFNDQRYLLGGDAYWDDSVGQLVLTEVENWRSGRIYLRRALPIERFEAEFDLYIGGGNISSADGATFAWVMDPGYPQQSGGALDFRDASGHAVEFDTYYNGPENQPGPEGPDPIVDDHIALLEDTAARHLAFVSWGPLSGDRFRHVVVRFDRGQIRVDVDGDRVLEADIPGFSPSQGYFGFTAATGSGTNRHVIDNFSLKILSTD